MTKTVCTNMPTPTDDLGIREHNWEAHKDIQKDMCAKVNGLFTCIIKISAGNIVDYVEMENITYTSICHEYGNPTVS